MLPICATMPTLEDTINAPVGQALPYVYAAVMGSAAGALGLTILVLIITFFCSVSVTVAASRSTWAFARDKAIPVSGLWSRVDAKHGVPIWALFLTTVVQMLLGLLNLGSSSAFVAFVAVAVIALSVAYAIPIAISMWLCRTEVDAARWTMGPRLGWPVNVVAVLWIAFQSVLFSMPQLLPVTEVSMNYASVVFVGLTVLSLAWYGVYAHKGKWQIPLAPCPMRKQEKEDKTSTEPRSGNHCVSLICFSVYQGPPEADGLAAQR